MVRKKISPGVENKVVEGLPSKSELLASSELQINPDELNEIKAACKRNGISIDDYVRVVKEALIADKTIMDKYGDVRVAGPDHEKRLKAAMVGLELEGYINVKGAVSDNSKHTHVTYAWLNAPVVPVRDI